MLKIVANSLLKYTTSELWDILTGQFILVFEDGEIITDSKETILSSYIWDLFRDNKILNTLKTKHHISKYMKNRIIKDDTHLKLMTAVHWDVYDILLKDVKDIDSEYELRAYLKRRVTEISNYIYNDLTAIRCTEYTTTLDILDFIEVHNYVKNKHPNDKLLPSQHSINKAYKNLQGVLMNPEEIPHNAIGKVSRSGIANPGQVNQCLGPRGFVTDTDSNIFPNAILNSYLEGIHSLHDSMIDSRLASKSLTFSKEPLQQAEYFSRRLQLMNEVVQNLNPGDCGSKHYLTWQVRGKHIDALGNQLPSDLKNLRGKYYLTESGELDWIRGDEEHLIGKIIKMRSPIYCIDKDPYGFCTKCFGKLSLSSFKGVNIGQYCWTYVAEKSTQSVLSVKHYDGSSVVDEIYLTDDLTKYLKVGHGGTNYQLSDNLKGKKVYIIVSPLDANGLNDVHNVDDVKKLNITRVSELDEIGIGIDTSIFSIPVGMKGRKASFTYKFLEYIKKYGYTVNERNNYCIDMENWDWEQSFMTLPLKHYNMSMHSAGISKMIESAIPEIKTRDTEINPDVFLMEFYDLVNSKLVVNLAVLEVVVYGIMIQSALNDNYNLPKPHTDRGLGVMRVIMNRRSISALMAFEGQKPAIIDAINYLGSNRMPHPFDDILMPELLNNKIIN